MVGDAYNMRHPLTGGGMTVAFNDAVLLTELLRPGGEIGLKDGREGLEDWEKIRGGLRGWFWKRKNLAGVVNVLSMALYDLFGGSEGECGVSCSLSFVGGPTFCHIEHDLQGRSLPSCSSLIRERCQSSILYLLPPQPVPESRKPELTPESDLVVLREGCFRYFQLGGECVAGPVGFLSV